MKSYFRATLRATLLLVPLFGIPQLLTSQRGIADLTYCTSGDNYYYAMYSIEGIQGMLVALLFCYTNTEVLKYL